MKHDICPCPSCNADVGKDQRCHKCGWPNAMLGEPEMPYIEGSEVEGLIDMAGIGLDGVCRPVFINQDGENFFELTIEDARRLLKFLNEAIPFLEQQAGMTRQ